MKLTKPIAIVMIILCTFFMRSQVTYNITNTGSGSPGSADVVFAQAQAASVSGLDVTINMNAGGLCPGGLLLNVPSTGGAITIQRDLSATVPQGFTGGGSFAYPTGLVTISGYTNFCIHASGGGTVNLVGITFQSAYYGFISQELSYLGAESCTVSCPQGIFIKCETTGNSCEIKYCKFINTGILLPWDPYVYYGTEFATARWSVVDNAATPYYFRFHHNDVMGNVGIIADLAHDNLQAEIHDNYSSTNGFGVGIGLHAMWAGYNHTTNNYLTTAIIENNQKIRKVTLVDPLNTFVIRNNLFDLQQINETYISIVPSFYRNYKSSICNKSISECNNQLFASSGNTVTNPPLSPSAVNGIWSGLLAWGGGGQGCLLTEINDFDIYGTAVIDLNVSVRRCRIVGDAGWGWDGGLLPGKKPIWTNNAIGITSASTPLLLSGNLYIDLAYTPTTNVANNNFYFDFYKTDANGSLLDYIGEVFVPNASINGNTLAVVPVPSSITLSSGDPIAITVTGIHAVSSATAIGTSEAFYPKLMSTDPCCTDQPILALSGSQTSFCQNETVQMSFSGDLNCGDSNIQIDMGEGAVYPLYNGSAFSINKTIQHSYCQPGPYLITAMDISLGCIYNSVPITITQCNDPLDNTSDSNFDVPNCQSGFKPSPGKYVLSFWVREDLATMTNINSYSSGVDVIFTTNAGPITVPVYANAQSNGQNQIIDGWQKVEAKISIPNNATDIAFSLKNNTSSIVYFDDIRLQPFNSSFKSFVYDPVTLRLSAELDERNNATFYEYDEEGKLTRVKKETVNGIKTIKESRSGAVK